MSRFFDIEYFRSPHGPCVCGKDRRRWSDRVVVPVSLWVYSPAWAPDPDPKHPAKASDHSVVVRLILHKKWHQREDSNTATALAQDRPSPLPPDAGLGLFTIMDTIEVGRGDCQPPRARKRVNTPIDTSVLDIRKRCLSL